MASSGRPITLRERLRYRVDNGLTRGVLVVLIWLSLAMLMLVFLVALAMWAGGFGPGDQSQPFFEDLWMTLTRSLDPGTFGQDEGNRFRLATLAITVAGILAVSLVIGLISNAVDRRLKDLRRGRSLVVEHGHTLILGTSGKLPIVVRELVAAWPHEGRHVIVILTSQDKVELEDRLKQEIPKSGSCRIVVRCGEPAAVHDLEQVRPEAAKSIIILRPDLPSGDAEVVRVSVAVLNALGERDTTVVAELLDPVTAEALKQALHGQITTVLSGEVVARIAAQTVRAAGLGQIYQELLDFQGDEFYVIDAPSALHKRTFGESLLSLDACSVVGLQTETLETDERGRTVKKKESTLCPDFNREIRAGDRLIVIAEDMKASRGQCTVSAETASSWSKPLPSADTRPDTTLLIGWNRMAPLVAREIARQAAPSSMLHVLVDSDVVELQAPENGYHIGNLEVIPHVGAVIDAHVITDILAQTKPHHVLVLCSHEALTPLESDARTLLTLLHLDNAMSESIEQPRGNTNVVAEIMLTDSVDLARFARPDDFIVSQRLVSLLISQLAEQRKRGPIFEEVLGPNGTQIEIHGPASYGGPGEHTYAELIEHGRSMGVIVIGWQKHNGAPDRQHTFTEQVLNPPKSERFLFSNDDRIIVLVSRGAGVPIGHPLSLGRARADADQRITAEPARHP